MKAGVVGIMVTVYPQSEHCSHLSYEKDNSKLVNISPRKLALFSPEVKGYFYQLTTT